MKRWLACLGLLVCTGGVARADDDDQDRGADAVKVREIEHKVDELKEQIFRQKGVLNDLRRRVFGEESSGVARAMLRHTNTMGSSFRMVRATYTLDGVPIFAQADDRLDGARDFVIYDGPMSSGSHTLSVLLEYQGAGKVFTYMEGYRFKVRSSYTFTGVDGRRTELIVNAHEQGNLTTAMPDRPAIDFRVNVAK